MQRGVYRYIADKGIRNQTALRLANPSVNCHGLHVTDTGSTLQYNDPRLHVFGSCHNLSIGGKRGVKKATQVYCKPAATAEALEPIADPTIRNPSTHWADSDRTNLMYHRNHHESNRIRNRDYRRSHAPLCHSEWYVQNLFQGNVSSLRQEERS